MPHAESVPNRTELHRVEFVTPPVSRSHVHVAYEFNIGPEFMLAEPEPAPRIEMLSAASLTPEQIELGKKIAEKHGLLKK